MTKEPTDDCISTGILRESSDPKNHDTLLTADRFRNVATAVAILPYLSGRKTKPSESVQYITFQEL